MCPRDVCFSGCACASTHAHREPLHARRRTLMVCVHHVRPSPAPQSPQSAPPTEPLVRTAEQRSQLLRLRDASAPRPPHSRPCLSRPVLHSAQTPLHGTRHEVREARHPTRRPPTAAKHTRIHAHTLSCARKRLTTPRAPRSTTQTHKHTRIHAHAPVRCPHSPRHCAPRTEGAMGSPLGWSHAGDSFRRCCRVRPTAGRCTRMSRRRAPLRHPGGAHCQVWQPSRGRLRQAARPRQTLRRRA